MPKSKKTENNRAKLIDRMVSAYKKRKRTEKIEKLKDNPNHWKGLQ